MTDNMKDEKDLLNEILNEDGPVPDDIDAKNINLDEILEEADIIDTPAEGGDNKLAFLSTNGELFKKTENEIAKLSNEEELARILSGDSMTKEAEATKAKESKIPKFKDPIEFINYMETTYLKNKIGESNVFYLKNYSLHSNTNFVVLQFLPKTTLSSRFFKDGNIITSIAASADVIFTGNNLGRIRMYSCEKEYEYKSLSNDEIISQQDKRAVVCMDISENIDLLVSGYKNGYIALWDLSSGKCKKLMTKEHEDCVISVKFIKVIPSYYEILSSDLKGNVKKITISEGFFLTSVDSITVMTSPDPIFLIEVLKLTDSEIEMFADFEEKPVIAAFGSLEKIVIYQIEPEPKRLFVFTRPLHLKNNYSVPDIGFGIGYPPRNKPDNYVEDRDVIPDVELTKPHRLIAISWGKVIYIYKLPFNPETGGEEPIFLGHYVNMSSILRIGFLSNSILYIFDMYKYFKILNTGLLTPGNLKLDPADDSPVAQFNSEHSPELEKPQVVDQDILFQAYIPDKSTTDSLISKPTYNNLIISQMKTLYILGKKCFHYGKLLNWEQCLNNLQQNSEWMIALTLGLDIFHGRNITLADIPIDENERKTKVGYILKGLILQYVVISTGADPNQTKKEKFDEIMSKCINICIEFCLEINDVSYLMTQIYPLFETRKMGDLFIEKLEPFILCDKLSKQKLGKKTMTHIKELYLSNNKIDVLSEIISHLSIESVEGEDIKALCVEKKLLTPLIYIFMNSKDQNYFYPIQVMFELFSQSEMLSDFVSYNESLEKNEVKKLEKSKQYIGHKLLWYIDLCLSGKKFKTDLDIPEESYKDIAKKITLWLMKDTILEELLKFDSFTVCRLLEKITEKEPISKLIVEGAFENDIDGILLGGKQISKLTFGTMIEILIEKGKKINKILILQDIYELIVKICVKLPQIEKDVIIEAIQYLLGYQSRKKESNQEDDEFSMHLHFWNEKNFLKELSDEINAAIESRKDVFTKQEMESLLKSSEGTSFIYVKIFLLNLIGDYIRCLDTYLEEEKIENKKEKTFGFVETVFKKLKDSKELAEFKKQTFERFEGLGNISVPDLVKIVEHYYNNDNMSVLKKIKDKNLQLKYLECVLEKVKEENIQSEEQEMSNFISLLNIHLDLLCELGKTDQILPNLKKRQSYPVEESLQKCLKYQAYDAAIYLYKTTGALNDAFKLSIKILNETIEKLFSFAKENKINEFNAEIQVHEKNIERCVKICQENSDKNIEDETEQIWFNFLQIFYDTNDRIKKEKDSPLLVDFNKIITNNIRELLEEMYSYVGIKKILDNVTVNYKQAEFKDFKSLLTQMLSSYSHIKTIFQCAQKLLSKTVELRIQKYNKFIIKGNHFELKKCDECSSEFSLNPKEKIVLFNCGHKMHLMCCIKEDDDDLVCPICRKFKIENSVTTMKEDKKKVKKTSSRATLNTSLTSESEEDSTEQKEEDAPKPEQNIYKTAENFARLRSIEKSYMERTEIFKKKKFLFKKN